jgi:hypothetical protein
MSGQGTETQAGGFAAGPDEAFEAAASGGGCCGAPAQAAVGDVAAGALASPCCGTALASGAGCCG